MTRSKTKFDQPEGFQFGHFKNDRGLEIRYGQMKAQTETAKGTLVLGPGYGETIEKYFELIHDLTSAGYDIWIMDWAGQGGSARHDPKDPQRSYDVKHFIEHHRDDLYRFMTDIVTPPKDHKLGYLGFSMGAHIGLRFMEQYHYIFDVAALNSTFFDLGMLDAFERSLVPILTQAMSWAGKGGNYVLNGGPWSETRDVFAGNRKTHDQNRFQNLKDIFNKNAKLRVGDPRVDWLHNILPSLEHVKTKYYLKNIRQPILLSIAGDDKIVSVKAQRRAAGHLFNACALEYPGARHEIWIEEGFYRKPWLENMLRHLEPAMKSDLEPVRIGRVVNPIHPEGIEKHHFPCFRKRR